MYVGLWSRLAGFERNQLTRALERRTVVQGTLMRATIHLVSKPDYWLFASGTRARLLEWWLRVHGRGTDTRAERRRAQGAARPARQDAAAAGARRGARQGLGEPERHRRAEALESIDVRRFRDEEGKELVDLARLPLPDAETAAPVEPVPPQCHLP
jgi:Winged helix DNA-binding domain